jgi:hypothetical protein
MIFKGEEEFLRNREDWYRYVWCEELSVQGWRRMWNPLDSSRPYCIKPHAVSGDQRPILQRFELARLISEGERMRREMKVGSYYSACGIFGNEVMGYYVDEIGCALLAKFEDPKQACELFKNRERELPESNPLRIRIDYVCAELLGLSFELIDACSWTMYMRGDEYDPQRLAKWLRATATMANRSKTELDRYRQRVKDVFVVA